MTTPQGMAAPANFWAGDDLDFCPCSEQVLGACPCGRRLRGAPRSVTLRPGSRPGLDQPHPCQACDQCGTPYPWADRNTQIDYLLRMLRQQLPPRDREVIADDLERLRAVGIGDEPEAEGRVWAAFKRGAFAAAVAAEVWAG